MTRQEILTVDPEHTLSEAARRIRDRGVGSAVVVSEEGKPGIITERDLLRAIADGADPTSTRVGAYMTPNAVTITLTWHVVDAARTMMERGFRHLIVLNEAGQIVGMLSIRDMVRALLKDRQASFAG
ncbi:MAG: CBS domain-containing protein [Actinomycetota bacterium]|nr:CBS domain-containing protein [Actinomycetota bacterium]